MTGNISYKTSEGEVLTASTFFKSGTTYKGCLIFVHGFKGFKDWGFGPHLGQYFADSGFYVITFNFSHNGISGNNIEFTEINKFAANTYSREISELNELISAVKSGYFGQGVDKLKIGLIGHSRDGAVSIITAALNNNIEGLVTWSAVANFDRFSERQKKEWKEKGYLEVINSRTKQVMRLNLTFLEDITKNSSGKLNIKNALKQLRKPYLIIHGQQDMAVPIIEAETIFNWSNKENTEYLVIPNSGHTFDVKHPFEGSNIKFDKVLQKTNDFFNKYFS